MTPASALKRATLSELRPTQATVGRRQVEHERDKWRDLDKKARRKFLKAHLIPTVSGPRGRRYLIDNHHLALALHEEGVEQVFTTVVADLTNLAPPSFWRYLDNRA